MNATFPIVYGPSKGALFDACKYLGSESTIHIEFAVAWGYTTPKSDPGCAAMLMYVRNWTITGIEHEDNSGDNLIIRGLCRTNLDIKHMDNEILNTKKYEMHFDAKRRTGSIRFI